jgi:uncharacterized membrane protein YczE
MVGLQARGFGSVRTARTGIEVTVLVIGWSLGGTIGPGTLVQAVTIGPLVQLFLGRLGLPPLGAAGDGAAGPRHGGAN